MVMTIEAGDAGTPFETHLIHPPRRRPRRADDPR